MIPKHPFELTIFYRDGKAQVRQFERLDTALAAARGLRPALVTGYKLTVVIEYEQINGKARHDEATAAAR